MTNEMLWVAMASVVTSPGTFSLCCILAQYLLKQVQMSIALLLVLDGNQMLAFAVSGYSKE